MSEICHARKTINFSFTTSLIFQTQTAWTWAETPKTGFLMTLFKYVVPLAMFLFHWSFVFQNWPTTILVVSHDRSFLNSVSTDILHLHNKQLTVYKGNYENFHRTREERLKNQQKEYDAQKQYRDHIQVKKRAICAILLEKLLYVYAYNIDSDQPAHPTV